MPFKIDAYFEPHVAQGARRVDAILSVTAHGQDASDLRRAIGIVLDASYSMQADGKMEAAKASARQCVRSLPADALFTVCTFAGTGRAVVPLGPATPERRSAADAAIEGIFLEGGGTRMSTGLDAVRTELEGASGAIAYAYLLTDGKNEHETRDDLDAAIARAKGRLQVDCRGLGADWRPDEVRAIANGLLGTADAVPAPARLAADFQSAMVRALSRTTRDVRLRLWSPGAVRLASLRQTKPEDVDLEASRSRPDPRTSEFPLGAWGAESRDYHAVFEIGEGGIGDEIMVCRPCVTWEEHGTTRKASGGDVVATWSADERRTGRMNAEVAHYTGQSELRSSIEGGLQARDRGDVETATRLLGHAARIAASTGNEEVTRRLKGVVDVVDAPAGTVRLRRDAGRAEALELEMGATRTVRRRRAVEGRP